MYKISVIVPVYGAEKYIEKCAHSLFGQTLDNIEYIFINDCSPDKSEELLRKTLDLYPHRKSDTKIVRMPSNKGQAVVRRYGIHLAQGEYVIHCDSDDWIENNAYESLYKKAKDTNADIVICDFVDEYIHYSVVRKQYFDDTRDGALRGLLNGSLHCSTCNKLIRTDIYHRYGLLSYDGVNMWEDVLLIIPACAYSSRIIYLSKGLYHYIHYNTGSITTKASKKSLENIIFVLNVIETFLRDLSEYEKFEKDFLSLKLSGKLVLLLYSIGDEQRKYNMLFPETDDIILRSKSISKYWRLSMFLSSKSQLFIFNFFVKLSHIIKVAGSLLRRVKI